MPDVTVEYYLQEIAKYPKTHWKTRLYKKKLDEIISGYRVTAFKERGKFTGEFCSQQANILENRLNAIMRSK